MDTAENVRPIGSSDGRAPHGQVSTTFVRALVEVVQRRNISAEALLGPSAATLCTEPAERFIPHVWFECLLARAIHLTREPALGLHCGLYASEASFGLMSPLIAHAPNLRRGIELIVQFQALLVDGVRLELVERTGTAELRLEIDSQASSSRSFVEFLVAGLLRALQLFGCARSDIHAVHFEHSHPAYYAAYTAAFDGAERFAQASTGIEFAARALDRPHLHRHAELHRLVLAQAERNLKRLWRPVTCTERVRALMNTCRASELPDMIQAAKQLGISVRSLRRHLEDEGTSYRTLTQAVLRETACTMLRNPAHTLQGVAHELGFSDATAFHRAFRRWAALTPAHYRSMNVEGGEPLAAAPLRR